MRRRAKIIVVLCVLILITLGIVVFIRFENTPTNFPLVQERKPSAKSISDADITAYLLQSNFARVVSGGEKFVSFVRLGENLSGTQATEYVWAVFQEYALKDGKLERGANVSTPLALYFDKGIPVALNAPQSGALYAENVKNIFPDTVTNLPVFLSNEKRAEMVADLQTVIKEQAMRKFGIQVEKKEETASTTVAN